MKCAHCQAENPEDAKFCVKCGKALLIELTCPNCGVSSPPGSIFCKECGHSLAEPAPAQAVTSPSTPQPSSFASGRYQVKKFLGEGGKKKVYLALESIEAGEATEM